MRRWITVQHGLKRLGPTSGSVIPAIVNFPMSAECREDPERRASMPPRPLLPVATAPSMSNNKIR